MKLRATIISPVEEANLISDCERRRLLLNFVIVGGGYSGVEPAGQIVDLLNEVHPYYKNVNGDDFSVSLVHNRGVLLPTLAPNPGEYTRTCLEEQGGERGVESSFEVGDGTASGVG